MKREYTSPVVRVTTFEEKDVLKVSGGSGDRYDFDDFETLDGLNNR